MSDPDKFTSRLQQLKCWWWNEPTVTQNQRQQNVTLIDLRVAWPTMSYLMPLLRQTGVIDSDFLLLSPPRVGGREEPIPTRLCCFLLPALSLLAGLRGNEEEIDAFFESCGEISTAGVLFKNNFSLWSWLCSYLNQTNCSIDFQRRRIQFNVCPKPLYLPVFAW